MMSHKEEDSHISPRNMGDDLSMAGDGVPRIHDDGDDDLYARLPRTSTKLRPNRRSSFYQKERKPAATPFEFPLDPDFNVGCNDDLLFVTSSVTSEANSSIRNLKRKTRNWKLKQQREVSAKLDQLCTEDLRLKRAPLPTSITWNGNAGKPLEEYISKFKGHVAQQDRLGYILKDELHRLWVKHGDLKRVLLIGIRTRIHPFLSFISVNQFLFDIVWLYGALQQSLPGKGSTIVKSYERSQDGILVWKKFLATYRHGGNVAVYLNQQQFLLQKEYHLQYPGGMLQFVEDFETAFTNIDAVCEGNPEMAQKNVGLYTDQGKRELFISNFSAGPGTMDMIEAVESTTTTWPDMVDALRQRIAQRIGTQQQVATKHAHLVQGEENSNNNPPISWSVVNSMERGETPETTVLVHSFLTTMDGPSIMSFVYSMAQDWNVGNQLWPHLPQQVKDQIIAIRKEQRPTYSGGESQPNSGNVAAGKNSQDSHSQSSPTSKPNSDVIKAPPKPTLPRQYSTANLLMDNSEDDNVQTCLKMIQTSHHVNTCVVRANIHFINKLATVENHLAIVDGGADTHLVGSAWLCIIKFNQLANIVGYDEASIKKKGLSTGVYVSMYTTDEGKPIFLWAKHGIQNESSRHTLLSSYQMREVGFVVDDVSTRHMKPPTERGTHSIQIPNNITIGLQTRAVLSTFVLSQPSWDRWVHATPDQIVDISQENWNPQLHYEDILTGSPDIANSFNVNSTKSLVNIPISEPNPYLEQYLDSVSMTLTYLLTASTNPQ